MWGENVDNTEDQINEMIDRLGQLAEDGRRLNRTSSRSRELSLMITKVEEAILWLTARQNDGILVDPQEGTV